MITPSTMRVRYAPGQVWEGLVGFQNGIPLAVPPELGRIDLTAGASPFTSPNARPDLSLSTQSRALIGTFFDVALADNPLIAGLFLDFAPNSAGVSLPTPLFAPMCTLYLGPAPAPWTVTSAPTSTISISIPYDPNALGTVFGLQAVALLPDPRIVSNGVSAMVGNY